VSTSRSFLRLPALSICACTVLREPALSLREIAEAIDAIGQFTQGMDAAGHCQVEANLYDFSGALDRRQYRKSIS
jgi:hypothetical protein